MRQLHHHSTESLRHRVRHRTSRSSGASRACTAPLCVALGVECDCVVRAPGHGEQVGGCLRARRCGDGGRVPRRPRCRGGRVDHPRGACLWVRQMLTRAPPLAAVCHSLFFSLVCAAVVSIAAPTCASTTACCASRTRWPPRGPSEGASSRRERRCRDEPVGDTPTPSISHTEKKNIARIYTTIGVMSSCTTSDSDLLPSQPPNARRWEPTTASPWPYLLKRRHMQDNQPALE
jgi:hypothetical protein